MKAPCKHPGCNVLLNHNGYCDDHKPSYDQRKEYDHKVRFRVGHLAASAQFRSSHKWNKARKIKLAMNPICEDPYKEHERRQLTETAKQVHHIVGLKECAGDERAYSLSNLMAVCTRCHARLERDEIKRESSL